MNKGQFVDKIREKTGLSAKDAENAYKAFIETVVEALREGDKISLVGFGTFDIGERAAREGRNTSPISASTSIYTPQPRRAPREAAKR